jgi:hypothetical protein|tara:strand:- start:598 stop:849 length:252 start_codon:yes stop_codon:yes gene_type:complete
MNSNKLTDEQIVVLKEIKDAGVFWSDAFGGADIQIVGSDRRYYALYQGDGMIIEITDAEIDALIHDFNKQKSVCCPLEMAFEN